MTTFCCISFSSLLKQIVYSLIETEKRKEKNIRSKRRNEEKLLNQYIVYDFQCQQNVRNQHKLIDTIRLGS